MKHRLSLPFGMLALWLCAIMAAVGAENPPAYDRVELSVTEEGEVRNDIVSAVVYRELQGPAIAPLAAEVNQSIGAAVDRIKQIPEITVETLDYQTFPVYDKEGRFTGWRVRQSIRLESKDITKLGNVLGELQQQQLALGSLDYSVSPELLRDIEDTLITEALRSFEQRADLIANDLKRAGYRLVSIRVDTGPPPIAFRYAPALPAEAAAPPPIEPGKRQVQVTVSGTIELQPRL